MRTKNSSLKAKIIEADPIMRKFVLENTRGKKYTLVEYKESSVLLLRKAGEEIGRIIMSSNHSGAIKKNSEIIGEYSLANGDYKVTPIKDGALQFKEAKIIHPLDYLLEIE